MYHRFKSYRNSDGLQIGGLKIGEFCLVVELHLGGFATNWATLFS